MKSQISAILAIASLALVAGCDMSPDQIKALSKVTGAAVTVTWMSYDNPSEVQKTEVSQTIQVIEANIGIVGTNTYVEVFMPKIKDYVIASTNIPENNKSVVIAGSLAILGGIDQMFASNPTWKADTQNVGSYFKAFLSGAEQALALPVSDPQVKEAYKLYTERSAIKHN